MAREAVQAYLSAVGARIRWRRARRPLLEELAAHIDDQAADYRAQGMGEEEALERAVAEMGDPEAVGRDLDRLHRPDCRWELALGALLLLLAGVYLQYLVYREGEAWMMEHYARQAENALAALAALGAAWLSDCTRLLRRRWTAPALLLLGCLGALLLGLPSQIRMWSVQKAIGPCCCLSSTPPASAVSETGAAGRRSSVGRRRCSSACPPWPSPTSPHSPSPSCPCR